MLVLEVTDRWGNLPSLSLVEQILHFTEGRLPHRSVTSKTSIEIYSFLLFQISLCGVDYCSKLVFLEDPIAFLGRCRVLHLLWSYFLQHLLVSLSIACFIHDLDSIGFLAQTTTRSGHGHMIPLVVDSLDNLRECGARQWSFNGRLSRCALTC